MKCVTLALNPPHSLNNYIDFLLCIMQKNCKHLLHLPESSQGFCLHNRLVKCHWSVTMGQRHSVPCLKDLGIYKNHSSKESPQTNWKTFNRCIWYMQQNCSQKLSWILRWKSHNKLDFAMVFPPGLWKKVIQQIQIFSQFLVTAHLFWCGKQVFCFSSGAPHWGQIEPHQEVQGHMSITSKQLSIQFCVETSAKTCIW